jgi:hypothetical protein
MFTFYQEILTLRITSPGVIAKAIKHAQSSHPKKRNWGNKIVEQHAADLLSTLEE